MSSVRPGGEPPEKAALAQRVTEAWSDPDALADTVLSAMEHGWTDVVSSAAEHLFTIDPQNDRRYFVFARFLAKQGQFTRATSVLERYEQFYGATAQLEITRALIAHERHLDSRAEEHLWRAVTLAPNEPAVLHVFLRTVSRDAPSAGRELEALERAAAIPESWVAKLWLSARLLEAGQPERIDRLIRDAILTSGGESAVLIEAVIQIARAKGFEAARRQAALHGVEHDAFVALVLLSAARRENIREGVQPLLDDLARGPEFKDAWTYFHAWLGGSPRAADGRLNEVTQAITTLARTDTPRYRQQCYRMLLRSNLLVACEAPAPQLRSDFTVKSDSTRPSLTTRTSSVGSKVGIAFSDHDARAAWRSATTCVPVAASELFKRVAGEEGTELIINPAGPASLELDRGELQALADGAMPAPSEEEIAGRESYFLVERFEHAIAPAFIDVLARQFELYPHCTEAWLVQSVEEKFGTMPTIILRFHADSLPGDRRETIADLGDPDRHPASARRIRYVDATNAAGLLATAAALGIALVG